MSASLVLVCLAVPAFSRESDVERLISALLGTTPLVSDLQELTDVIGGRPTGSEANLRSVEWGLSKFREAGVSAGKEGFEMPRFWLEKSASARVSGGAAFPVHVVSMAFSTGTPPEGLTAPLVEAGRGAQGDFDRLGRRAEGAFVLVETEELRDIAGLFREYSEAGRIEERAFSRGVQGVVYMSSRPNGVLYRHVASRGKDNRHPMLVMEREQAERVVRLLRTGRRLNLNVKIEVESGGPYESYNVIGEIQGSEKASEIVIVGAHLDSWGLGTGANDNGCNVAMMIDIARQIRRLGLKPRRTIRFALWNGEEQGMVGSWGYTKQHRNELDRHVAAISIDIGSGRITGFFTNGREDVLKQVSTLLEPVAGLGPFENITAPIVGTDNFDFLLEGVPNLVGNQEDFNYGANYHAESDTFDKVDLRQLRLNAAKVATVVYGLAESDRSLKRQSRAEIEALIRETSLSEQMKSMGFWEPWEKGQRGRTRP